MSFYEDTMKGLLEAIEMNKEERKQKNMKLYFKNSQGKLRVIAEPSSEKECITAIKQFLDEHNFKSYYTRTWKDDKDRTWYDVGSHTEFFIGSENCIDENDVDK